MNKINRLIFLLLAVTSLTACGVPKEQQESKSEETTSINQNAPYQVNETRWNNLFYMCQCFDPFLNVTIDVKGGGMIMFGKEEERGDLTIKISNGQVYVDGYQDYYYVFKGNSYNEQTGKHTLHVYQEDINEVGTWIDSGEGEMALCDAIGGFATAGMSTRDLDYKKLECSVKRLTV